MVSSSASVPAMAIQWVLQKANFPAACERNPQPCQKTEPTFNFLSWSNYKITDMNPYTEIDEKPTVSEERTMIRLLHLNVGFYPWSFPTDSVVPSETRLDQIINEWRSRNYLTKIQ